MPDLKKLVKLAVPFRTTIKAQKPSLALRLDYDFAHMEMKAIIKELKQEMSINTPLEDIPYFQQKKEFYVVQLRIIY